MSFQLALASSERSLFDRQVTAVVGIIDRLVNQRAVSADYLYYRSPCPWLQCKCLKFLKLYPFPSEKVQARMLSDALKEILSKNAETAESNNAANTINCVLMDAVDLVIMYGPDVNSEMHELAVNWLGRFIEMKDANTR